MEEQCSHLTSGLHELEHMNMPARTQTCTIATCVALHALTILHAQTGLAVATTLKISALSFVIVEFHSVASFPGTILCSPSNLS